MKFFESTAVINAAPDTIWRIITDAPNLANWDSGIEKVEGKIEPGETIKVYVKVSGQGLPGQGHGVPAGEKMVWSGACPLGLFKGVGPTPSRPRAAPPGSRCARSIAARCCP